MPDAAPSPAAHPVFAGQGTTIFETMSRLAQAHGAINLGQGFPDDPGAEDVRRAAADALMDGWNQYPSMMGLPALRQAVAAHAQRFYGLEVDWATQTIVGSGATEILAAALLALLNTGDEVVVFQPCYDAYVPMIRRAGGVPRLVTLRPPDWSFDLAELRAAVTPRTRLILLNTPHNPTAKVFAPEELAEIARLVDGTGIAVLCDEVYEHITFDGQPHVPLMTLPSMRQRTVRVGSAGKTFSLTGWKVGYASGPAGLIGLIAKAHQFLVFTTPPNLQAGVAYGLAKETGFFTGLAEEMQRRRDRFVGGLMERGYRVLPCAGTYFCAIDVSPDEDVAFCQRLTADHGVAAIPLSAFYPEQPWHGGVRFCFAKADAVLDAALTRLPPA